MKQSKRVGPNLFDITDQFHGKQFLHSLGVGGGGWFQDDSRASHYDEYHEGGFMVV